MPILTRSRRMARSRIAGFCDLPTELLHEIASRIDNSSLLELAATCKWSHFIALKQFYSRNGIPNPASGQLTINSLTADKLPEVHTAVRLDLSVQKLDNLFYSFSGDITLFPGQLNELYRLIQRLSYLNTVCLNFQHGTNVGSIPSGDGSRWRKLVFVVLDLIIAKSCQALSIINGGFLADGTQNGEESSSRDTIGNPAAATGPLTRSNARKGPQPKSTRRKAIEIEPMTINHKRRGSLRSLSIQACTGFRESIYDWTRSILSPSGAASSTLRSLSFIWVNMSPDTWASLLKTISLPQLSSFQASSWGFERSGTPAFRDFHAFCLRHPTITSLTMGSSGPFPLTTRVPKPRILPNITTISLSTGWLCAVLGTLDSHPNAFPKLQTINLMFSDAFVISDPDCYSIDKALGGVAKIPPGNSISLNLVLLNDSGRLEWLTHHVELGVGNSVLSQLTCVTTLSIDIDVCCLKGLSEETEEAFAEWIQLFPCVKHVDMRFKKHHDVFLDLALLKELADACPKMQTIKISDKQVNLAKVRDGADSIPFEAVRSLWYF